MIGRQVTASAEQEAIETSADDFASLLLTFKVEHANARLAFGTLAVLVRYLQEPFGQ